MSGFFSVYTRYCFVWNVPLCDMKTYSMMGFSIEKESMSLYRNRGFFDSLQSAGTELSVHGIINNFKISISAANRLDKPRFPSLVKSNIKFF